MNKDTIYRQDAIKEIHKAIFEFFDICDDDEESPMTYQDKRLLELNKAITTQIKALPSAQPDLQEYSVWFRIGETLVDVSKMHITAEEGIEKIRSYLMRMKKPERKTGHWIRIAPRYYKCSECGVRANSSFANFCHRCGSDMRGEEE